MNNCVSSSNKQIKPEPQSYKPLVLLGPTGVGKSDVALELAEKLDGQIINADSAQMYTPLTIGTAKPDYKKSKIGHHCYDILNEPVHYNVMQYRQKLIETVQEIQARKKVPIIVGGSGFYIKSLLYPPAPADNAKVSVESSKMTWDNLNAIDPVRAAQIHPHDTYRIKRALEIWYHQGIKPSQLKPVFAPWDDMTIVWLDRDRNQLYERINQRVLSMIDAGWIEEVQALRGTAWETFLRGKKIIGYDSILAYLDMPETMRDKNRLIEQIQRKTRNYAKAQKIFWGSLKAQIESSLENYQGPHRIIIMEINLTLTTHDLYINQLLQIYLT